MEVRQGKQKGIIWHPYILLTGFPEASGWPICEHRMPDYDGSLSNPNVSSGKTIIMHSPNFLQIEQNRKNNQFSPKYLAGKDVGDSPNAQAPKA